MKHLLTCSLGLILLAGCNGFPTPFIHDPVYSQYLVVNSGPPLPLMFQGSAIQWNSEYAVTAKHIPFLWNVVHRGKGDVAFFKHRAARAPEWRQYRAGEKLTSVGFSPFLVSVKSSGMAKAIRLRVSGFNDGVRYSFADMALVKGMSGGPVFGEDQKVVGINIGFIPKRGYSSSFFPEIAGSERLSIFLAYDEILREWEVFEAEQAGRATN